MPQSSKSLHHPSRTSGLKLQTGLPKGSQEHEGDAGSLLSDHYDDDQRHEHDLEAYDSHDEREFKKPSRRRRGDLARPSHYYSPEEERQVVRKFDWNLVPFLALLYLLSFLDRSSELTSSLKVPYLPAGYEEPTTD